METDEVLRSLEEIGEYVAAQVPFSVPGGTLQEQAKRRALRQIEVGKHTAKYHATLQRAP